MTFFGNISLLNINKRDLVAGLKRATHEYVYYFSNGDSYSFDRAEMN